MRVVGIRGAITVDENSKEAIISSVKELLQEIVDSNALQVDRIVSVFFTATKDLNAAFPAAGARELGWKDVALLDAVEMDVPDSMERVIRVLVHVNVVGDDYRPNHVYLKKAANLRPDLYDEGNST